MIITFFCANIPNIEISKLRKRVGAAFSAFLSLLQDTKSALTYNECALRPWELGWDAIIIWINNLSGTDPKKGNIHYYLNKETRKTPKKKIPDAKGSACGRFSMKTV